MGRFCGDRWRAGVRRRLRCWRLGSKPWSVSFAIGVRRANSATFRICRWPAPRWKSGGQPDFAIDCTRRAAWDKFLIARSAPPPSQHLRDADAHARRRADRKRAPVRPVLPRGAARAGDREMARARQRASRSGQRPAARRPASRIGPRSRAATSMSSRAARGTRSTTKRLGAGATSCACTRRGPTAGSSIV